MPMTLATFKRDIDSTILGRGRRYYNDGHVVGLDELTATSWQAEVAGTYPYTVTIHIADDDTLALGLHLSLYRRPRLQTRRRHALRHRSRPGPGRHPPTAQEAPDPRRQGPRRHRPAQPR